MTHFVGVKTFGVLHVRGSSILERAAALNDVVWIPHLNVFHFLPHIKSNLYIFRILRLRLKTGSPLAGRRDFANPPADRLL